MWFLGCWWAGWIEAKPIQNNSKIIFRFDISLNFNGVKFIYQHHCPPLNNFSNRQVMDSQVVSAPIALITMALTSHLAGKK
jgi:hypothetical protein